MKNRGHLHANSASVVHRFKPRTDFLLTFFSAVLLILAFPRTDAWILAWAGLVPFFLALDGKNCRQAWKLGYCFGVVFFSGTLYWLIYVTVPGAVLFVLYLSLYIGLFAAGDGTAPSETPVPERTAQEESHALPRHEEEHGGAPLEETQLSETPPPFPTYEEVTAEEPTTPPPAQLPLSTIDTNTRRAVVHLLCTTKSGRTIRATTGSGVIIDPRGVVLTNAHVAQFWLLPEKSALGTTECRVRSEALANREFRADVLYFPQAWVLEHAADFNEPDPKGTGEYDFALLYITEPIEHDLSRPPILPSLTYSVLQDTISEKDAVLIAAYPAAGFFSDTEEFHFLNIVSAETSIQHLFTFKEDTLDLISLGPNALSSKGSSGGAVVDESGTLIALISTSTDGETLADRELRAITLAHINRSLIEHTGFGIAAELSGDLAEKAAAFERLSVPALVEALLAKAE